MCGICGTVGISNRSLAERAILRMNSAMIHRGPDEQGELILPAGAPDVALGMRRLSIIDLRGGSQPIFNEARDVAIVYNGEIYNFRELREELAGFGHNFRTHSDTEVIVHAYEQWGADCLGRLRGMFAVALLDMRDKPGAPPKLLLARDRLGIKPLYYAKHNGVFLFASEVRALLAGGIVPRTLSAAAVEAYLLFGSVPEPLTLMEGVYSLPPGQRLILQLDQSQREIAPEPYWTPADSLRATVSKTSNTLERAATELRPVLDDAIERHLIADVELGVFLSSGLDSTAITGLASRKRAHLRTFTLAFEEQNFNEASLARETARRYGTRHEEILLRGTEMAERLDEAIGALDQPTMDGINTYFISWAARRVGLKVALSGLGGDEVFGGYSTFAAAPKASRVAALGKRLPRAFRSATATAVGRAGAKQADARRKLSSLWADAEFLPHPYFFTRLLFTPEQALELRGRAWVSDTKASWRRWMEQSSALAQQFDAFTAISCLEMRSYMEQTLLRDTDSVSMANSLEVRVPFLDHILVESVLRLPSSAKRRAGVNKALLVECIRDLLPEDVVRQPKRTFTLPWEAWLRGPLAAEVCDALSNHSPALSEYLDSRAVARVWKEFEAGRTSWSRPWALFVLSEWCRRHLAHGQPSVAE